MQLLPVFALALLADSPMDYLAQAGINTESITWITPFVHSISVFTTVAVTLSLTPSLVLIASAAPLTVLADWPSIDMTSEAITFPAITWYVRIAVSLGMSFNRLSTVPAGSLEKASSVGAKTVNGPVPLSVATRFVAVSAAARVVKVPAAPAVSMMSCIVCFQLDKRKIQRLLKKMRYEVFIPRPRSG